MIFITKYGTINLKKTILEDFKKVMGYDITIEELNNFAGIAKNRHKNIELSKGVELEILEELSNFGDFLTN